MLKLNQKGIIHLFLLLILIAGIIGGIYLVKHPAIFKPKAYETNPSIDQYDTLPDSLITSSGGTQNLFKDAGKAADYSITYNQTDDGVEIEFEPQELTEDEAKTILNNTDIYYLKMLMWLLLDTYSTPSQPFDPWYALCDHLSPEILSKVGAEPTTLADDHRLTCSDPAPGIDQFFLTDPHNKFTYKKFPAKLLVKMIEAARLTRENKDLFEHVKDTSPFFVPIIGPIVAPTINAMRTPGSDPLDVANETLIWTIIQALGGQTIKVGLEAAPEVGRVAWGIVGPVFKNRAITLYIKEGAQETFYTGGEIAGKTLQRLKGGQKLLIKLAGAIPNKAGASIVEKIMIENTLLPLIQAGKAYVLSPDITRPIFTKLLDGIDSWEGGALASRLGGLHRNEILETIENNLVVVVKDKEFIKTMGSWKASGFTYDKLVILKESAISEGKLIHEFNHVIHSNMKRWLTIDEHIDALDPQQAEIFGGIMSQIFEQSTDIIGKDLFGYAETRRIAFPKLALTIDKLIEKIILASNGNLTRTDFMEYALTRSASRLMRRISETMTIEEFMAMIKSQMDTVKLVDTLKVRTTAFVSAGSAPATATGIYLMQDYFATQARGEQLPEDAVVIPVPLEEDIDISLSLCCPPGSGTSFQDCKRPGVDTSTQCCHADEWFSFYMVDKTAEACNQ